MIPMKKEGEGPDPGKAPCRSVGGIPGQGSRKGFIGEQVEGRRLMELSGRGCTRKGEIIGNVNKEYI